jgi:hypothetical protein
MVIEMMKHWEIAVDGIQIFLCLLILFFLLRNHRRRMNPDLMNPKIESGQDFNLQVFSQSINQQVELAFTNILEVAANERRNLDKVLQFQPFKHVNHSSPEIRPQARPSHRDDSFQRGKETTGQGEHRTRIQIVSNTDPLPGTGKNFLVCEFLPAKIIGFANRMGQIIGK